MACEFDKVSISITREDVSKDDAGGVDIDYTAAARASAGLPTSFMGMPVVDQKRSGILLGAKEAIEYGVRGDRQLWNVFSCTDPKVDSRDRLTFTDWNGTVHTLDCVTRSVFLVYGEDIYACVAESATANT